MLRIFNNNYTHREKHNDGNYNGDNYKVLYGIRERVLIVE